MIQSKYKILLFEKNKHRYLTHVSSTFAFADNMSDRNTDDIISENNINIDCISEDKNDVVSFAGSKDIDIVSHKSKEEIDQHERTHMNNDELETYEYDQDGAGIDVIVDSETVQRMRYSNTGTT